MQSHSRIGFRGIGLTIAIFCWAWGSQGNAWFQMEGERYQLGRRLVRFEQAWQTASPDSRAACVAPMEQAVASFFGLQLAQAAERLDQAYVVASDLPSVQRALWTTANQFSVDFESPCVDSNARLLRFRLLRVYRNSETKASPEAKSADGFPGALRLELIGKDGECLAKQAWPELACGPTDLNVPDGTRTDGSADSDIAWCEWLLPYVEPGAFGVRAVCVLDSKEVEVIAERVAILDDLPGRTLQIEEWYAANRRAMGTTEHSTARWLAKELIQATKGKATETDLPWNQWFRDFEFLRDQKHTSSDWIQMRWPDMEQESFGQGSRWVALHDGQQSQIVRLEVPALDRGPLPVVFAFHGAGGSENMFFESYGAGRLITLARERSWLVVSPRQTLGGLNMNIAQMLTALQEFLPIDSNRIALVGHSMGAAQAIAQVSQHADKVHAVAALGGGGNARRSDALARIPFFIAAGDRDFGRPRAKALADQLQAMDAQVNYREYANVEHMVIVQAALDDVFKFLDQSLAP